MNCPLFSIILPTFNRPRHLPRAIRSVLRQGVAEFELIVVDDASDEPYARRICTEIADQRIEVLEADSNGGVAAARNRGIEVAKGTYVSFLDDDDEYVPNFLQITAAALRSEDYNVAIAWSSVASSAVRKCPGQEIDIEELFLEFLEAGAGCGVTIRSDCLRDLGGFVEEFTVGEDTELFVRALSRGYLPMPLPSSLVKVHSDARDRLTDCASFQQRALACEWIRVKYSDFLNQYPRLRKKLSPGMLSAVAVAAIRI
jgi:glycosyltransferase involved in cell wall biosynthesis